MKVAPTGAMRWAKFQQAIHQWRRFSTRSCRGPRNGYLWDAGYNSIFDYGDDKGGHYSSARALHNPYPECSYSTFLLDAESSNRGLHYSVVDMSLNGGLGDIILADAPNSKPRFSKSPDPGAAQQRH